MEYGKVPGIDEPVSRLVQGGVMLRTAAYEQSAALLDNLRRAGFKLD